jgi:hypothetical protein
MLDELMDRYGEPPRSVQNLLKVALLKSKAHDVYLTELTQKNDELCFVLWQKAPIDPDKVGPFMQRYQRRLRFVAGDKPHFAYILPAGGGGMCDVLGEAERLIDDMQQELLACELEQNYRRQQQKRLQLQDKTIIIIGCLWVDSLRRQKKPDRSSRIQIVM